MTSLLPASCLAFLREKNIYWESMQYQALLRARETLQASPALTELTLQKRKQQSNKRMRGNTAGGDKCHKEHQPG